MRTVKRRTTSPLGVKSGLVQTGQCSSATCKQDLKILLNLYIDLLRYRFRGDDPHPSVALMSLNDFIYSTITLARIISLYLFTVFTFISS